MFYSFSSVIDRRPSSGSTSINARILSRLTPTTTKFLGAAGWRLGIITRFFMAAPRRLSLLLPGPLGVTCADDGTARAIRGQDIPVAERIYDARETIRVMLGKGFVKPCAFPAKGFESCRMIRDPSLCMVRKQTLLECLSVSPLHCGEIEAPQQILKRYCV
jgi:hypothetical protein